MLVEDVAHDLKDINSGQINPAVDRSGHEGGRFLNIVNNRVVLPENKTPVIERLRPGGLSSEDCKSAFGLLVTLNHALERKVRADVAVHYKKGLWAACSDLVSEVVHPSGGSKGSELLEVPDADPVDVDHLLDEVHQLRGVVRADYQDFIEGLYFNARLDVVLDHRQTRDREQRLRDVQRQWTEPGP